METAIPTPQHKALKIVLALLLCLACVPAQALTGAEKAWADTADTPLFYETIYKKGKDYTLVLQTSKEADKSFGTKVWQRAFYTWLKDDYLYWDEDGSICDGIDEADYSTRRFLGDAPYSYTHIVVRDRIQAPADCFFLFYEPDVVSMDLSGLDTSHVRSMEAMFYSCYKLRSVDLSSFDTSNVTNMSAMFCNCYSRRLTLDLTSFDTRNVTDMSDMFHGSHMRSVDLSSFDTSNVTDMSGMFCGCQELSTLDLSSFDTRKVKNMKEMFGGGTVRCLDLSNFTFPKGNYSDFVYCRPFSYLFSVKLPKKQATFFGKKVLRRCARYVDSDTMKYYSTGKWLNSKNKAFSPTKIPSKSDTYRRQLIFPNAPLTMASQEYTGKPIKPTLMIDRWDNSNALKRGLDYTVTFKNNKNVGTATAVVKGKGHIGQKTIKFKINPKGTETKSIKAAKKGFKLTWKKPSKSARSQIDGYQVRWSLKSSMKGAKTKTVKGASKTSAKVSKLKGGRTYYVQVRSYKKVGGKTYYSTWSEAEAVKTNK